MADGSFGLQVIDISNPVSPSIAGSYDTPGTARQVVVSDGYAYIAARSSGLQVIDIRNPVSPSFMGSASTPSDAFGLAVSSGYAYVATWGSGLQVFDIGNPASPSIAGEYAAEDGQFTGVAISGDYAYVVGDEPYYGIGVIDVEIPRPRHLLQITRRRAAAAV